MLAEPVDDDFAADVRGELRLPETAAISVITLGELRAGVELAKNQSVRAVRSRRPRPLHAR